MNLHQHIKNQFISFIFPQHTAIFIVLRTAWPYPFLTMPTPIFFNQLLFFMKLYQLAKKTGFLIILFYRYSWFKNPVIWLAKRILAHISRIRFFPKLLAFLNLYQHEKNELIWSIHYWDTADFRVSRPKNPHPFSTNTMQKLLV